MKKAFLGIGVGVFLFGFMAADAGAFECTSRMKDAQAAIDKAVEAKASAAPMAQAKVQAKIDEAKKLLAEVQAYHSSLSREDVEKHVEAAKKAKMAKAVAEEAETLAKRLKG